MGEPVRLEHVTLRYGELAALDDVSLAIPRGQRVCVLGANGSGKSTLVSVICGLLAPDEGTVELVGRHVCQDGQPDLEAYRLARRKLGLVFQNPDDQIVTSVVADDVAFGPENLGLPREEIARRVGRELKRVALTGYAKADPSRMSGGQRQRVCIAGALAMEPQVLVLDEPSSLLDVRGRGAIMRVMGRLSAAGATLVHVTHFMDEALAADRVIVMSRGRVALDGTPGEVFSAQNAGLIESLGLEMPFEARLERAVAARRAGDEVGTVSGAVNKAQAGDEDKAPIAEVSDVCFAYSEARRALDHVSFCIPRGRMTAIVGQTGSGKSTLLRLLCGLAEPDSGTVTVTGASTSTKRGRKEARRRVGFVMQHPERQLFAETVAEDVAFGPRNLGLSGDELAQRVDHALKLVGLAAKRDASPFELSGGQRRLAAIAGVLAMQPELLILDEPTAGLDPRGRAALRRLLCDLRSHGVTLVQVTHSMDDAARADQVVVLDESRVLAAGTPEEVFCEANEPQLKACGLGLPRPLAHAIAHGLAARPLTIEALAAALVEKDEGKVAAHGL